VADGSDVAWRFGRALRSRREALGLSQEELAHDAGLHRTYVSLIERGHRSVSINVIQKLASAMDVRMVDLVSSAEER